LSNLNIYSSFRLQTTDIMVTQPSTCLRLSDNTASAITWWRRLPEKFCRYPILTNAGHIPKFHAVVYKRLHTHTHTRLTVFFGRPLRTTAHIVNISGPSGSGIRSFLSPPPLPNNKGTVIGVVKYMGAAKICDFQPKSPLS